MVSISDALEEILKNYPFLEEGLSRGIINYSALARDVKPTIEKRLYKSIKMGAIVMALKRLEEKLPKKRAVNAELGLTDITVRSNLSEYTYLISDTLANNQRQLLNSLTNKKDVFCTFSEGVRETTIIASTSIADLINNIFQNETLVINISNLSSITIRLPKDNVETPGLYYQILKRLAWENINVVEVISTYTEITVVFRTADVDKAFSVLKRI